jgi:hydroxymethylglutaryl-CoA reductase
LGEHAVVYGRHALALPIPNAVGATVSASDAKTSLPPGVDALVAVVQHELDIEGSSYSILIQSRLSRGMGLGSSAAVAVAIVRAFDRELGLGLDDERINAIAFECEKLAHGTPSGIDNTVATYATPMLFCNSESLQIDPIVLAEAPPIVIGCSSNPARTSEQVAGVRERYDQCTTHYDAIFDEIDALSKQGATALAQSDYASLGAYMNICHGLLSAIEVSTAELDSMVSIARAAGAAGAKLTGGGGGGCIVALCPDAEGAVSNALHAAGFRSMSLE